MEDKQAGIDCINCGHSEVVTTEADSDLLVDKLEWLGSDPVCPECGNKCTYEYYLD